MGGLFQKIKWLVILWLARRLPDCKQITRRLGEALDHEHTWREKLIINLHLFTCEACERYLDQVAFLKAAAKSHGERAPDSAEFAVASLSPESRERIQAFLRCNDCAVS